MASLGLAANTVEIHDYSPGWPLLFEGEKERLSQALGDRVLAIEHIGSTAVPGLGAKPVIDILIAVEDFERARDEAVPLIEATGYSFRGDHGIPRRHYFQKGEARTHQIHMFEMQNPEWTKHLAYRDFLRTHIPARDAYDVHKRTLAAGRTRAEYQEAKSPFIARLTQIALRSDNTLLQPTDVNGVHVEPYAGQFPIPAITEFMHRGYASLLALGLRFVATHQQDATTLSRITKGQTFVAIQNEELVGIITCYGPHLGDGETYGRYDTAKFGHFTVDPTLRTNGIGSQLLERAEEYARAIGFDYMALDTAEPATHLISYYSKRGYSIVERVKWEEVNYASVIMRKRL